MVQVFNEAFHRMMVRLYEKYSATGKFEILAFPCNQFGEQEPWEDEEIEVKQRGTTN